ncbi:MAG TPA: OmpA family protein [Bacteroidales bacterium]
MKKSLNFIKYLPVVMILLFTSCVANKKYKASQSNVDKLQKENANTQSKLNDTQKTLNDCNEKIKTLNSANSSLQTENSLTQKDINDLKALAAVSKMTIADQATRLKTLQDMIQAQKDIMNKLKNSIADALMNYKTDELSVYIKNGNVYVSLEEKLLFKSGSDVMDPKGKAALKSLAMVLNNTSDITVMIEGHTDNVPIKTASFKDNWDLSTARATSILRLLTKDYGFDPIRITASGRGEFHPVKSNDTVEGKAANRRTEIILSPNLSEIYQLLYQ